jgi:hypothetical protein
VDNAVVCVTAVAGAAGRGHLGVGDDGQVVVVPRWHDRPTTYAVRGRRRACRAATRQRSALISSLQLYCRPYLLSLVVAHCILNKTVYVDGYAPTAL